MSRSAVRPVHAAAIGVALVLATTLAAGSASANHEAIVLGDAATFGVLGGTEVTNTGPTTVEGHVGVYSGTLITGFDGAPGGTVLSPSTKYAGTAEAQAAQADRGIAFNTLFAHLAADRTNVGNDLAGQNLVAGVYAVGDGSTLGTGSTGVLTLTGDADDVFIFLAESDLVMGSASSIVLNGDVLACNVYWGVRTSATLNSGAQFIGTIVAHDSITLSDAARVEGRVLAGIGNVTLINNVISAPNCTAAAAPPAVTGPTLAATGADASTGIIAVLALLALGGAALIISRRSRAGATTN